MNKILVSQRIKFHISNSLEKYRIKTLLTKEPETIEWIKKFSLAKNSKSSQCFFDIGANIGIYSLYAASLNKKLKIFAFEPEEKNYLALIRNIKLNNFKNIFAFKNVITNKNCIANLFVKDYRVGNSGSQIHEPIDETNQIFNAINVEKVMGFSLDSLIKDFLTTVPTFIKIDVDGHEKKIIKGMSKLLKKKQLKSILVEFNSKKNLIYQSKVFKKYNFHFDKYFNSLKNHSDVRRIKKAGYIRNVIFSKK